MDWYNENDSLEVKQEKLFRKICKCFVEGKMNFTEHADIHNMKYHLEYAVKLEEYEAAQIFKECINKLENNG